MKWSAVYSTVLVAFLGAAGSLLAQETRQLPLAQAIDLAKRNSPVYLQTLNNLGPADWSVRSANANLFLPRADLSFFGAWQDAGAQRLGAALFAQPAALISQYQFSLSYTLDGATLFQPGQAKAERTAAERRIDDADLNLRDNVTRFYIEVLRLQARAVQAARELRRAGEHLRLAEAREQVGAGTRLETMQADVARGRAEVDLVLAENAARVAKLRLIQTLGIFLEADQVELVSDFDIFQPQLDMGALVTDAITRHPSLVALRADQNSAHSNVKVAKASYFPSLSLRASWTGFTREETNPTNTIDRTIQQAQLDAAATIAGCETFEELYILSGAAPPPPFNNCSQFDFTPEDAVTIDQGFRRLNNNFPFEFRNEPLSLSAFFSMPVFNGFNRQLQVEQAIARENDFNYQVRGLELQIRADVTEAVHNMETSYQTVQLQQENTARAQEELRLARERYQLGAGTFLELLDSETLAAQAEVDQIESVFGFHQSLVALEAAVGRSVR